MSTSDSLPVRVHAALPALPESPPLAPEYLPPGMSLAQLLTIVRAFWRHSLIITVSLIVIAAGILRLLPKTYTATAVLIVNYELSEFGKEFPIGEVGSYMATQVEFMKSDRVLLPVIDMLHLTSDPEFTAGFSGSDPLERRVWVLKNLRENLNITQGRGSQLLYVDADARDARNAARIANTIADVYLHEERQLENDPASQRAREYTGQLAELQDKVTAAQERVTAFRQRSGLSDIDARNDGDARTLNELEQQLLTVQNDRRSAEAHGIGDQSVKTEVLASETVQALKGELTAQEAQLAQLSATLGPRHPKLLELKSRRDATRAALQREIGVYSGNSSSEVLSDRQLEQALQSAVDQQRAKVVAVRQQQDEGAKLLLELESAQAVYKRALDGYDQIMFASGGKLTNVSLMSRAVPAVTPTKPRKVKMLTISAVGALVIGLLAPLACGVWLRRRVRCRDDLERDFGMPVLAVLERLPLRVLS